MYNQWLLPNFFDNSHNTQKIDVYNLCESPQKRSNNWPTLVWTVNHLIA
jgi:hypothetical protein